MDDDDGNGQPGRAAPSSPILPGSMTSAARRCRPNEAASSRDNIRTERILSTPRRSHQRSRAGSVLTTRSRSRDRSNPASITERTSRSRSRVSGSKQNDLHDKTRSRTRSRSHLRTELLREELELERQRLRLMESQLKNERERHELQERTRVRESELRNCRRSPEGQRRGTDLTIRRMTPHRSSEETGRFMELRHRRLSPVRDNEETRRSMELRDRRLSPTRDNEFSFRRSGLLDGFPDVYCGREAILKRGISQLTWPVQEGLIQNWDELEKLLHHTFYKELMVAPEETKVMYALHPLTPGRDKEKMAELLFETFTVDGIYLAQSPALVTLASGRTTGLVWENGYSCCYAAPVFEGFPLKHSIVQSQLTGHKVTSVLLDLFKKIGYSFTTPIEIELAEKIKASLCFVAEDLESVLASRMCDGDTKVRYQLPDGQHIILDEERFICPEVLFRPSMHDLDCPSIVSDICTTISKCDLEYQPMFYDNIVLSGGGSQFAGLDERLYRELSLRVLEHPDYRVTVDAMESRQHAAWRGGSMLASMQTAQGCYMSKQEHEDAGAMRVRQKFY